MTDEISNVEFWVCDNPAFRHTYSEYTNGCPKCYARYGVIYGVRQWNDKELSEFRGEFDCDKGSGITQ
jgi:hypothetical protein